MVYDIFFGLLTTVDRKITARCITIIYRGAVGPDVMAPTTGQTVPLARYSLCGVLYTVDVLHPNAHGGSGGEETWLHIDDESVSSMRYEDVFRRHGNECADDRCAYLLFYCRRTTSESTL